MASPKRRQIFEFILSFLREKGYTPTVREIQRGCGISSPAVVQHHLNFLEKEGEIRRDPEVFRSIQVLSKKRVIPVPLLGSISAGQPLPVTSSDTWTVLPEEMLELPQEVIGGRERVFALKVKGNSMIDALIGDGDIVLIQPAVTVADGEMVAIWLKKEQEMTLKRIYRERARIRLQPANQEMAPLYSEPENVEVQGRVIGVLRKL